MPLILQLAFYLICNLHRFSLISHHLVQKIFSNITPWQRTLIARHPDRPKTKHYIENLIEDFFNISAKKITIDKKDNIVVGQGSVEITDSEGKIITRLSKENIQSKNRKNKLSNIDMKINNYIKNLIILENNTDNIIEYVEKNSTKT